MPGWTNAGVNEPAPRAGVIKKLPEETKYVLWMACQCICSSAYDKSLHVI